jgi:hypothetical protein
MGFWDFGYLIKRIGCALKHLFELWRHDRFCKKYAGYHSLFCDCSVIKLQNIALKRCIITLMSLAIKGIRDSAMRRNNRVGGSNGLGYKRWSCAIRRT